MSGAGLDAEAQGTAEPWAQEPKANVNLKIRSVNLAPLLDLKPADTLAQNIGLSSRRDGCRQQTDLRRSRRQHRRLAAARAPGADAGRRKNVEGEIGLDTLALAPAFALAIGAAGHDAAEPLGAGLVKGWRGRIAFQALRGALPGGVELQQVGGTVKTDGQSLAFDDIKGRIGGGEATANIDARPGANGISLNARVQLAGVDGARCIIAALAMPAGRASMQMTLASQGRSASALVGALSGNGTVTLESARNRRARSARVRGRGPRQRQRAGEGRHQAEADRRAGAVGRRAVGGVGADSVHHPRRADARRRHHDRRPRRARRHLGRLRYSRRPGRHPRRTRADDERRRRRPAGNSVVRGGHARCARPHASMSRRCRHGWRCGRSITKPAGSMRSSAASRPPPAPTSISPPVAAPPPPRCRCRGRALPGPGPRPPAAARCHRACRHPAGRAPAAADRSPARVPGVVKQSQGPAPATPGADAAAPPPPAPAR